jgi:hypothetical protein
MQNAPESGNASRKEPEYKKFAIKRILVAIILIVAVLWIMGRLLGVVQRSRPLESTDVAKIHDTASQETLGQPTATEHAASQTHASAGETEHPAAGQDEADVSSSREGQSPEQNMAHPEATSDKTEPVAPVESPQSTPAHETHKPASLPPSAHEPAAQKRPGVALIDACIQSLHYELHERWWGWRPNDILQVTDNVNQFQLGVLEATRRAFVNLAERISRTGSTDAFNISLEKAMNWIMIKPDRYWFPSAESAYDDALNELRFYKRKLELGQASFYTRADNLIPLLSAFEDLLGSCDENLVKTEELDGSSVGYFKSDDYFFYAKGVASTLLPILEAVSDDFSMILETRHGTELLHHAIENCRRASQIDPILIFNSDMSGILANHRANMAAPISHARYYLGILIRTMSL